MPGLTAAITNDGVIKGLSAAHENQTDSHQLASQIAPFLSTGKRLSGKLPDKDNWRGLDFSVGGDPTVPITWLAVQSQQVSSAYSYRSWSIDRYPVGQRLVSDVVDEDVFEGDGFKQSTEAIQDLTARGVDLWLYLILAAVGTSGNYAAGHASDPGNLTTPSFALTTNLQSVKQTMIKQGRKVTDVFVAEDMVQYIRLNTEARSYSGLNSDGQIMNDEHIDAFFRSVFGKSCKITVVESVYKSSAGTMTFMFSGKIAFLSTSAGDAKAPAFMRTMVLGDAKSSQIGSVKTKHDVLNGIQTYQSDACFDLVMQPTSGVLWYGLDS